MHTNLFAILLRELGRRKALAFIICLVLCFCIFFVVVSWGAYLYDGQILRNGERSIGTVYLKKKVSDPEGGYRYRIYFRFPLNSRPDTKDQFPGSDDVSRSVWRSLSKGDTLEIAYDPANPDRSFNTKEGGATHIFLPALVTILCLLPILLCLSAIYHFLIRICLQTRRVLEEGRRVSFRVFFGEEVGKEGKIDRVFLESMTTELCYELTTGSLQTHRSLKELSDGAVVLGYELGTTGELIVVELVDGDYTPVEVSSFSREAR